MRWADLRLRVLSAGLLAPLMLACLWYGGVAFALLVGVAAVVLGREWVRLCGESPTSAAGLAMPVALLAAAVLAAAGQVPAGCGLLVAGAAAVWALGEDARHRGSLAAGVPYIGLSVVALLWLRADPVAGRADLLFLVLLVWASDIGAYLAGRLIGGPRLAPRISPGKTWSGALGGLLAAALAGAAVGAVFSASPGRAVLFAVPLGVAAQAGDLMESALKRRFGVKDSGQLIPGHGGLLDRIDAFLAVAPVAACLVLVAGRGVVLWG